MHKVLLRIGSFEIYSYSIMVLAAVLWALRVAIQAGRRRNLPAELFWDLTVYLVAGGALGARLLYVFLKWPEYAAHPWEILNFRAGGLSLHGALLGGLLAILWFARHRRLSTFLLLDLIVPAVTLGLAVGRIGCFLNGCCLGVRTTAPWGVAFPETPYPGHRHPTQIYELLLDLVLFAFLLRIQSRREPAPSGGLTLLFFGGYSIVRFVVEFWREDLMTLGPLSLAQWGSLLVVLVCACLWPRLRRTA